MPLCSSTARLHGASGEQSYKNCYFDKQGKGSLKEFSENYTKAYNATKNLGYIAVPSANHDYQRPNIDAATRRTS